jgi:uncharacterized protein (DUF302 family)
MLPCNVVIQEHENGNVEVTFTNPSVMVKNFRNSNLEDFACDVTDALQRAYSKL